MDIKADTKIDRLLKEHPFLEDFLVKLSPKFKGLKNPIMRKTVGKVATLEKVAAIGGLDLKDFLAVLKNEISRQSGAETASDQPAPPTAGEAPGDTGQKQAALKEIIKALHAGENLAAVKQRFRQLISGVEASEIAQMEQALMDEGLPAEEVKRL